MSLTVLIIMLLHAVPVYIIGIRSQSKGTLAIAAIISVGIGLLTGNAAYFGADLLAVVIAYWMADAKIKNKPITRQNPYIPSNEELENLDQEDPKW